MRIQMREDACFGNLMLARFMQRAPESLTTLNTIVCK